MLIEIVTIILTIIGMFAFHTVVNCAAFAFFVCSRLQLLPEERVQRFFIIRIFLICLYMLICLYAYLLAYLLIYAYMLALDLVQLTLLCRVRLASSAFGHTLIWGGALPVLLCTLDMSGLPSETAPDSGVSEESSKRHVVGILPD